MKKIISFCLLILVTLNGSLQSSDTHLLKQQLTLLGSQIITAWQDRSETLTSTQESATKTIESKNAHLLKKLHAAVTRLAEKMGITPQINESSTRTETEIMQELLQATVVPLVAVGIPLTIALGLTLGFFGEST